MMSRPMFASICTLPASKILFAILPKMSGMTIKKEKRAAFSLSMPNKTAVAMVAPLREMPGEYCHGLHETNA